MVRQNISGSSCTLLVSDLDRLSVQEALVPFRKEWCLEFSIWALGMFFATGIIIMYRFFLETVLENRIFKD